MRIAVAADERTGVADAVVEELRRRGHEPVTHGARKWNDANVLALSLRITSQAGLEEILDAWFAAEPSPDDDDRANVGHLAEIEG